jgi:UDP-2,4-diacetamido-2,4,6-trideoxy-beta-L-altropyranose hydrolase
VSAGGPTLLIRADASAGMGTGHVMRVLGLAQAWQELCGEARLLAAAPLPASLAKRLEQGGVALEILSGSPRAGSAEDVAGVVAAARASDARAAVIDHYGFGAEAVSALGDELSPVLCFDDYAHRDGLRSTWVVNPNLHARSDLYPAMPRESLLLGPLYAPLRREFLRRPRPPLDVPARARRLLVTLGGSDPHRITRTVVDGVAQLAREDLETTVVVGGANPDAEALQSWLRELGPGFTAVANVTDMAACLAGHDVVIGAGGTTTHELMYLGIPSLLVVAAENQLAVVASMDEHGVGESLGWHAALTPQQVAARLGALLDDPVRRRAMAERCRARQDGRGAERLTAALRFGLPLALRPAVADDRQALFDWANDPETRASSFRSDPIPWAVHVDWLEKKLADPRCDFWVGVVDDAPVGCIRFDGDGSAEDRSVVSVTVAPAWRGRGVGRALIAMGTRRALESYAREVHAFVLEANTASVRAFEAAGYRACGRETVEGRSAVLYAFDAGGLPA